MSKGLTFDPSEDGLRKTLKEYQVLALRYVWENGEGVGSGPVWRAVNEELQKHGGSISRASIIFSLNNLVDQGVLSFMLESGKGGMHRIYKPTMDEDGYKKYVVKTILESTLRDFPKEASEVIRLYI
jgi:predicted transcriptional regulator